MAGSTDSSRGAAPAEGFGGGLEGLRSALAQARIFLSRHLGPRLVPVLDLTGTEDMSVRPRRILAQLLEANSGTSRKLTGDTRSRPGFQDDPGLQGASLADAVRRQTARLTRANDRLEREVRRHQGDLARSQAREALQTALVSCADDLALAGRGAA